MKRSLDKLDSLHRRLLDAITPVTAERFAERPAENEWSLAELIYHLSLVEQSVVKSLTKELENPPQKSGLRQHLIPLSLLVGTRMIRIRAPKFVEPLDAPSKEVAIENFNSARAALKALCTENSKERLSRVRMKHPVLGKMNGIRAVDFLHYHEKRHYKQALEIIKRLAPPQSKTPGSA
ncbi:MAG: DinB family protein [Pyrinomonadaceae bacterium]